MQYKSEVQKQALEKQGQFLQKYNEAAKKIKKQNEQEVIDLYLSGKSISEIAKYFNCSVSPIKKVLRNIPKRKPGEYNNHISKTQKYGEKHHSWKGGYKDIYNRFRDISKYYEWRKQVLTRDENHCNECHSTKKLQVHHLITIKSLIHSYCSLKVKKISDLTHEDLTNNYFYELQNGLTLCEDCHKTWHKDYGRN